MPELNHNFIKGRMNKDLDERLVANGEYRDALNVEVSTSEGANVGAVQTTMGNTNVGTGFGTCVASIADEKNDDIYWLTAGSSTDGKDAILKYHKDVLTNTYVVTPVLVDVWKTTHVLAAQNGHVTVDNGTDHLHVFNLGNATENITNIRKGMVVTGTFINSTGSSCSVWYDGQLNTVVNGGTYTLLPSDGVVVDKIQLDTPTNPGWRVYLTSTIGSTIYTLFPSTIGDSITFTSEENDRVLQFDASRLITGLNILDDLMFWTDNHSEPKKINLTNCIEGTLDINTHSPFIVKNIDDVNHVQQHPTSLNQNGTLHFPILKEHITVIKKSPWMAPKLQMDDTEVSRGTITTRMQARFTDTTQNLLVHTSTSPSTITLDTSSMQGIPDWVDNDIVLGTNDANGILLFETWEVRLRLIDSTSVVWEFEIIGITADELPFVLETWDFVLERSEPLFEFKFPRFGYRYKYQDGEYSSFSPFSKVAFLPGPFDYNPKKGYNLGMKNQLRNLKILDFIEENSIRPKGVIAVDILYKESNSPNIYTVKTITTEDSEWNVAGTNLNSGGTGLTRGSIPITSEIIYATVPSNQLLRPWDNVPRKALAQDISANRLIYGNYLQNFNLRDISNKTIKINSVINLESSIASPNNPQQSIKSLRTYQLGLVYRDEFGRETPVLASKIGSSGTISIKKDVADKGNKLKVELKHDPPSFANSFKFFVKETSNEYYNLAMDRWYGAEDGNIWVSFPSSERNKVDEETYLILKKQHDSDKFVSQEARYKIISIADEVPDFIKRTKKIYGSLSNNADKTMFGHSGGGYPDRDTNYIYVEKESIAGSSLKTFPEEDYTRYLRFKTPSRKSHWYEIANILEIDLNNIGENDFYKIEVTEAFKRDMNFTTENATMIGTGIWGDRIGSGNSVNPGSSDQTLSLQIAKEIEEVKPEHRGRFFVKIYQDAILQENVMTSKSDDPTYVSVYSEPIYYLNTADWSDFGGDSYYEQVPGDAAGSVGFWGTWWDLVSFGSGIREGRAKKWWRMFGSHWFIDNAETRTRAKGYGDEEDNDGAPHIGHSGHSAGGITNDGKKIHLAFSGIYNPGATWASEPAPANIDNFENHAAPNLDVGANANLEENIWVGHITSVGTVFKWSKDPDDIMYVVEKAELYKSGSTKNANQTPLIKDELTNYEANYRNNGKHWRDAANQRIRWEITVGAWDGSGTKPTTGSGALGINDPNTPGNDSGYDPTEVTTPASGGAQIAAANHFNVAHAIEILQIEEDLEADYSSTNPAIFETEPKEDIGLDLYYEVSDANPMDLDYKTNEIYVPVTSYLALPGDRTWTTSNNTYVPGSTLKVTAFNDDTITINDRPLDLSSATLVAGDSIIFTKPSGGMVTGKVISVANAGSTFSTIKLDKNLHNRTYYLDWFNCFSFGNGVESNRIRDDFNAVTIDKGPIVSTTLATPYEEERKTNGLIYSGIYNSTSGVNNLNQFIMAENITKDLSPRFGSIQKLHARDSDLVAFCEDKVVKLLANKDAVYNADGNAQLIATNKVLGQTVPFAGEHGISKNPESFATQAYQSYFSDKSRGVVMRLSRDGLQPVSEHGMKDWFNDNLKHAQSIIGSYDDKKSLYNITLKDKAEAAISIIVPLSDISYADVNSLGYFTFDNGGMFGIASPYTYGTIGDIGSSYTNYNGTTSYAYGQYDISDVHISGGGSFPYVKQIHIPTIDYWGDDVSSSFLNLVDAFNDCPEGNVYLHYQVQAGSPTSQGGEGRKTSAPTAYTNTGAPIATFKIDSITTLASGAYNIRVTYDSGSHAQIDMSYFWWTSDGCEVVATDTAPPADFVETTVSFAEKTNGWVSFKSWLQESGLSMNGKFYTFDSGNLYEHESNLTRNNFYGTQYTSTIDVLLNDAPTTVKSFQTLKYSGSKSRITQNRLTGSDSDGNNQFDNEYYNNIGSTGWYASSIETDLQSGKDLEFRPKEGKWFTAMRGLATYFTSATDTNVDEDEFSVQGIGYAGSILCPDCDGGPPTVVAGYACDDNRIVMTDSIGSNIIFGVGQNAPTVNDLNGWFNQSPAHRAYTFVDYAFEYVNYATIPPTACNTGTSNNSWYSIDDIGVTIPVNTNGHTSGSHSFSTYADFLAFTSPIVGATVTSYDDVASALYVIYGYEAFVTCGLTACICDNGSTTTSTTHTLTLKDDPSDH